MPFTNDVSRHAVLRLIGNTPLMPLCFPEEGLTIHAKAEFLNPTGSIKDRMAVSILCDARDRGLLHDASIVLECSSGNSGIALAMVGAVLGHRVRILMSDTASVERRHLISHFGAELVLFKADRGYATGIEINGHRSAVTAIPAAASATRTARAVATGLGPSP